MKTSERHIHIVSFNVPLPADYGGVIDVFGRIRALHDMGVHIHLHCFTYGRKPQPLLDELCDEVRYYERCMKWWLLFSFRPFIVASRPALDIIHNIQYDDYPVLLEGLHCCDLLQHMAHSHHNARPVVVRMHNIEHQYYRLLARSERNPLRKAYLFIESIKLRAYLPILKQASAILSISSTDDQYLRQRFPNSCHLMHPSHLYGDATSEFHPITGRGKYVLYHANLSVAENEQAALWIINHVHAKQDWRLVIAGKSPSETLTKCIASQPNVELVSSPDHDTMRSLVQEAHICLMITFQATGLKLKLLHSLFLSRFCIANSLMVAGTDLDEACLVADSSTEINRYIQSLFSKDFTISDIQKRQEVIGKQYDNMYNANLLLNVIASI